MEREVVPMFQKVKCKRKGKSKKDQMALDENSRDDLRKNWSIKQTLTTIFEEVC